jgi:DNA-binding PadR family transcriptional regulator
MTDYAIPHGHHHHRIELGDLMARCARHGRGFGFGRGEAPFMRMGRRAGRGDIRAAILALLNEGPMHGYQIMRELEERSGGAWRVSPGSVYPTLSQLEDEELVEAEQQGGKRVFSLTAAGREEAAGLGAAPWQDAASEMPSGLVELRDVMSQVRAAARQVVHAGSEEQLAAAAEILRDTRKQLYRLLAEDEQGGTTQA